MISGAYILEPIKTGATQGVEEVSKDPLGFLSTFSLCGWLHGASPGPGGSGRQTGGEAYPIALPVSVGGLEKSRHGSSTCWVYDLYVSEIIWKP